jgi:uncharacterized protein (TIGR02145 family)
LAVSFLTFFDSLLTKNSTTMKKLNDMMLFSALVALMIVGTTRSLFAQSVKDFDGNEYKTVKIGNQMWTAANLNVAHFRNGDPIPEAKTAEEWVRAGKEGKPVWCYYDNDPANGPKYGKLYNWYAVHDERGLAPEGWRIPANGDWRNLVNSLGNVDVAGIKLKSETGWNLKRNANNKSGFSALPAGHRHSSGDFNEMNSKAQWWTSSGDFVTTDLVNSLMINDASIEAFFMRLDMNSGLSIRCIK